MASYPAGVYSPRTKENRNGVVYDAAKKSVIFCEDIQNSDAEIVAIETELGANPKGAYESVAAFLADLLSKVISAFTDLSDVPASYTDQAGLFLKVKATEDGLEFGEGPAAPAHHTSHENGGGDEISVAGLSGVLADDQNPTAHKADHENGGGDEISVAGLSGVLADDQSANNLNVAAAPSADAVSGIKITLTAAVNVALGDVGYINSSGKVALGDADAIASASCLVMATASISQDNAGVFLVLGVAHLHSLNPGWTIGALIYLTVTGTTGNTLSASAPTGTDDVIQILGVAVAADTILFKPQLVQVEHT